jgi:hypothetical protein
MVEIKKLECICLLVINNWTIGFKIEELTIVPTQLSKFKFICLLVIYDC